MQALILVAAALITTATNKLLYYFALYTNPLERSAPWLRALLFLLLPAAECSAKWTPYNQAVA